MSLMQMNLKPQDVLVLLKLCSQQSGIRPPYAQIASQLEMSPSEVHSAVRRLQKSQLLHGSEMSESPDRRAVEEYLIHGVKYSFPAERGEITRGIPTSYAAEPLNRFIKAGNHPLPVWPYAQGKLRGIALKPLYKSVPKAAMQDPILYELLALVDAIRDGRARERNIAERELEKRIRRT